MIAKFWMKNTIVYYFTDFITDAEQKKIEAAIDFLNLMDDTNAGFQM